MWHQLPSCLIRRADGVWVLGSPTAPPRGANILTWHEVTAVWSEPHSTFHSHTYKHWKALFKFHSESLSLRNYHSPFTVTFHLPGIGQSRDNFYWFMLKVAVTLKISLWLLNQMILWQIGLREPINTLMMSSLHGPERWCCLMDAAGLIQEDSPWWQRICTSLTQPLINLKELLNERKLLVCCENWCIFTPVCRFWVWSAS